jgi:CelD/BcsL family acetyltransferase involved in cellulose biosynthesis
MYARPFPTAEKPETTETPSQIGTLGLRLQTLGSYQDVVNAADSWIALDRLTTAPNSFFQSYAWCKNWIEHHAGREHHPVVFMVTRSGKTVAILPMMLSKVWGVVNLLRPLGEPHTQYANVLTTDGTLDDDTAQLLQQGLKQLPNIDTMIVQYVPAGSPLRTLFALNDEIHSLSNEASQYDLREFKTARAFDATLPSRRRQAKRRAIAALQADGDLKLDVIWPDNPAFAAAINQCLSWKMQWIMHTGRMNSGLGYDGHARFLSSIPGSPQNGGAVIFALYAGARPVAYQIGFIHHGQYHLYTASFDWTLRRWSLGTVLIDMTISWLVSNGVNIFDLMGNPAPYKGNWNNQPLRLSSHCINLTLRGKLYATLWVKRLRPGLKTAFHKLPTAIRSKVLQLRSV